MHTHSSYDLWMNGKIEAKNESILVEIKTIAIVALVANAVSF